MRADRTTRQAIASVALLILALSVPGGPGAASASRPGGAAYPSTSWALGVVIPEGAGLQGGGSLRWEDATNVSASVTLPDIVGPDGIVYGVMSVMAQGGAVMQAAAGVYPNMSLWLAYSWFIPNIDAVPLTYAWVLNGSNPQMAAGASVSMSIFRSAETWEVRILDRGTGSSVVRAFPLEVGAVLLAGDQEVFALESYTRSSATFEEMGNLTLSGVSIDGQKVVGGFYTYSNWNPNRQPVFGVGSAGVSPPGFISLESGTNGSFEWGFAGVTSSAGPWYPGVFGASLVLALLVPVATVVAVVAWMTRTGRRAKPHVAREAAQADR